MKESVTYQAIVEEDLSQRDVAERRRLEQAAIFAAAREVGPQRAAHAEIEKRGIGVGRYRRIARQRPGTAKGFVFLTLEDETGVANIIVRPDLFARPDNDSPFFRPRVWCLVDNFCIHIPLNNRATQFLHSLNDLSRLRLNPGAAFTVRIVLRSMPFRSFCSMISR